MSRAIPSFIFCPLALEVKLQCELHQAGIARPLYAAEVGPVREISVRLEELRVVEHVEKFTPELYPVAFSDIRILEYSDVRLEFAWAATNRPRCVTDGAEHDGSRVLRATTGIQGVLNRGVAEITVKRVRIETGVAWATRIKLLEWRDEVRLARGFEVETGIELVVVLIRDADRKTGLRGRCSRQRPTVGGHRRARANVRSAD